MASMMEANSTQFTMGPTNMTVAACSGSSGGYIGDSSEQIGCSRHSGEVQLNQLSIAYEIFVVFCNADIQYALT